MKNLGERIKQSIERIEAMQKELNERLRLQAAQASDRLWKYAMDHKEYMPEENNYEPNFFAYEAGQLLNDYAQGADRNIEDVLEALELDKQLHVIEATYRFTDEVTCGGPNATECRVYCPHTNNCYDLFACSFCKYQDDLIIKWTEADDPWTKAEDFGTVKYTKEGLYDYGYSPSVDPEELPF